MSISVQVPNLGESVVEGTVARWLVAEGDTVSIDQIIVELTTDKVDVEIPSPGAGVIAKILVGVDETVEVGAEIAIIEEAGASAGDSKPAARSETTGSPTEESTGSQPEGAREASPTESTPSSTPSPTPLAQRAADEKGIDTSSVTGTGARGRVTQQDVADHGANGTSSAPAQAERAQPEKPQREQAPPATALPDPTPAPAAQARPAAPRPSAKQYGASVEEGDRVIPMTRLRKLVADHMVYSKRTSPHVGTVAEIDMTAVAKLRKANKSRFEDQHGIGLTFLPFIVAAVVRALRETPALNAQVIDDTIVEKRSINIGIAVETEKGLVVPVVRDADRLSLAGLAAAIDDLSTRARNKKLGADELKGGTFTISNPGRKGNLYGFAIINQPQVGILRMGEMVKRPVVRELGGDDVIVVRQMMHLALSYDHRAVDGQPANAFLFRIRELLEAADFDL